MYLKKLSLLNFKNYQLAELSFKSTTNCFIGHNGGGKTNLLDAINYLSLCKSYFNPIDSQNIRHETDFAIIQGIFYNETTNTEDNIYCSLKRNQKKQFKRNQNEYQRLADHIGLFPVVMIAPIDTNLITEGSEERRKLIDSIISQFDKLYLDYLVNYNKAISQRNAFLKQLYYNKDKTDISTLEIWDAQIADLGTKIYQKRLNFIHKFLPIFKKYYSFISGNAEPVDIIYDSTLIQNNLSELLKLSLKKDIAFQYTTVGVHKDDLNFTIKNHPIKKLGSQGQQKSFLIALKLAQFEFIKEVKSINPILLLDDVFDKLDILRVSKLMELVSQDNFGQIFITDTQHDRIKKILGSINIDPKIFIIENGNIKEEAP